MRSLLQFTLDLFAPPEPALTRSDGSANRPAGDIRTPVEFRHPRANVQARLGDAIVGYELKRGKRRTIGFVVGPEGLVVSAPKWVGRDEVQAAVLEKAAWIVRQLGQARERHQRLASSRIEWKNGTSIPFLGQPVVVELDDRVNAAGAVLHADAADRHGVARPSLHLGLPLHASADQIRAAVQAWLMRQAKRVFTERLDHFAPRLQVRWHKLSLSSAGTRWGSARSDGSIRLHWRLIHFHVNVIDYVVAHELSHLRVMDHSPRFWDTVRAVLPDYAKLRSQLKEEAIPQWS